MKHLTVIKEIKNFAMLFLLSFCMVQASAQGSLLRKLQEKAEDKIVDEVFKEIEGDNDNKSSSSSGESYESSSSSGSSPRNSKGGGLDKEEVDINGEIAMAKSNFNEKEYRAARAAVKKAIMAVELEIGQKVLESFPDKIRNLEKLENEDAVSSTGMGFTGLIISRKYQNNDDQELSVSIGNEASLLTAANMVMASGVYTTGEDENTKNITFQDEQAVIAYDEYEGYSLSVPFGQSSIFMLKGINYENEKAFMADAQEFNIQKYREILGEK